MFLNLAFKYALLVAPKHQSSHLLLQDGATGRATAQHINTSTKELRQHHIEAGSSAKNRQLFKKRKRKEKSPPSTHLK